MQDISTFFKMTPLTKKEVLKWLNKQKIRKEETQLTQRNICFYTLNVQTNQTKLIWSDLPKPHELRPTSSIPRTINMVANQHTLD